MMIKKSLEFGDKVLSWLGGIGYGAESIEKEIKAFKSFIPTASVFVDVGANKGFYSEALIRQFQNISKIYLFEPSKTNFNILVQKYKGNNLVCLNNFGLADVTSNAILYSNESGSGLAGLSKRKLDHFGIDFDLQEQIEIKRFDEYWLNQNSSKKIDLFKIDVEGHELKVLDGIGSLINEIKVIQFEFGGCNIDTRTYFQDFWYFFQERNFDLYRITPLGPMKITQYKECYERFETTNYFCVNTNLLFT